MKDKSDTVDGIDCDIDDSLKCNCHDHAHCAILPMEWGSYCNYEKRFISDRYNDLVFIFNIIRDFYKEKYNIDGFWLNHTTVWKICYFYANDLKPIRQFHNADGGCDRSRRASILARLIALHRPVFIQESVVPDCEEKQGNIILQINEHFAWNAFAHFLNLPESVFTLKDIKKVTYEMKFIFTHRDPQIESLICVARLLEILADLRTGSAAA